ncbi:MAG: T9SS type A sorting domain-containing protein [Chitinophagales bacterium]
MNCKTLLILLCLFSNQITKAQVIDIQEVATLQWYGNDHFQFEAIEGQELEVRINKFPWESFTLDLGEIDIYQYPKVTIELSSSESLPLRVDLYDTQYEYPLTQNIEFANERTILKYDYSQGFEEIDQNSPLYLLFYAAPGENFAGKIQIHSIHFEALSTNIEEVTETVEDYVLRAFPNPTRDVFHVDLPLKSLQYINLYNTSGQVLFTQDISHDAGNRINIEVGYFPAGNYILQLEGEQISYTQQVVIE